MLKTAVSIASMKALGLIHLVFEVPDELRANFGSTGVSKAFGLLKVDMMVVWLF